MPANAFSAPGPYCIAKTPGGLPFVTRTAESPRPIPQIVRLPYISFKVAKRLAVTVQSRVAGLVTIGPTVIERVEASIWL